MSKRLFGTDNIARFPLQPGQFDVWLRTVWLDRDPRLQQLMCLGVAVLIFFLNHVPQRIHISKLIARIGHELIDKLHEISDD